MLPSAHPVWSPDGRTLAYRGGTPINDYGVFLVPADGSAAPRKISLAGGAEGAFSQTAWSPNGRELATNAGGNGVFRISIVAADGGGEHRLTTRDENEMFPSWSPTGTRIAYGRIVGVDPRGIPTMQLVVLNADGSDPIELQ